MTTYPKVPNSTGRKLLAPTTTHQYDNIRQCLILFIPMLGVLALMAWDIFFNKQLLNQQNTIMQITKHKIKIVHVSRYQSTHHR